MKSLDSVWADHKQTGKCWKLNKEKYESLSDEELIRLHREGQQEVMDFIMEKYKNLVKKKARAMYLMGGDNDDLIQEGMIGLFKAVRDYNEEKEASFYSFAELCISRQIYSAVEASNRQKHIPLNNYISLYSQASGEGGEGAPLLELLQSIRDRNPEELVIDREDVSMIEEGLEKSLSKFEKKVFDLYAAGISYVQIAEILDKTPKSVDNAIQRIKNKLSSYLANRNK